MTENTAAKLVLKKNEERRLAAGHLWVYSNEVDIKKTPLKELAAGTVVELYTQPVSYTHLTLATICSV